MHLHIFPNMNVTPNAGTNATDQSRMKKGNYANAHYGTLQETPEKVSIFSQYDDSKDNKLSYQGDNSTKQYIDAGQTKQDFTAGLEKNILSKIKVDVKSLWNTAVGDFNRDYEAVEVEKGQESTKQSEINNITRNLLDDRIKSANQQVMDAYTKAIEQAKIAINKEGANITDNTDGTQKPENKDDNTPKTKADLEKAGVKIKTRTREINGKKQEYIMYKDSSGETHRAVVKDDGTLDTLYQTNEGFTGSFLGTEKKTFVTESMLKEKFGDKFDFNDPKTRRILNNIDFTKKGTMTITMSQADNTMLEQSVDKAIRTGNFQNWINKNVQNGNLPESLRYNTTNETPIVNNTPPETIINNDAPTTNVVSNNTISNNYSSPKVISTTKEGHMTTETRDDGSKLLTFDNGSKVLQSANGDERSFSRTAKGGLRVIPQAGISFEDALDRLGITNKSMRKKIMDANPNAKKAGVFDGSNLSNITIPKDILAQLKLNDEDLFNLARIR